MPKISIRVAPDGSAVVKTEGYSGKACQDATRQLEQALGVAESERRTPEYYQSQVEGQQVRHSQ